MHIPVFFGSPSLNLGGRGLLRLVLMGAVLVLGGCADLQTVGRKTKFPLQDGQGLAIHLDAQQRLVLTAGTRYCAEPSPDALAAYASSLGFGISGSDSGSASTAHAIQSSAGSIGLRTQSITLMRDSLYRMCEASMNGAISPLQVAEFLRRSQDLTAVILAIEQLTGAVSANQVTLTGNASANASSQLLANQQALEQARAAQASAQTALDQANADAASKQTAATSAAAAAQQAQSDRDALNSANPPATPAQIAAADATLSSARNASASTNADLALSQQRAISAQQSLSDATRVAELIENARDASAASSSASTGSTAQMSAPVPRNQLDAASTAAIANAVSDMVKGVLAKDYTMDTCMTFLTNSADTANMQVSQFKTIKDACLFLIATHVVVRAKANGVSLSDTELDAIRSAVIRDSN